MIVHHEDWQGASLEDFLRPYWVTTQATPLPPLSEVSGEVQANVNHGRWIVDCPNEGCGNAIVVSEREPYYICTDCGSQENGGRWYVVAFPPDKSDIEAVLLERPTIRPFDAETRNWSPCETVSTLRRENRQRGIG